MKSLQLHKPHLLILVGMPGAGKSYFATQFSDTFNAPFVDYAQIYEMAGTDRLTYDFSELLIDQLLRTKQTIVMDGRGDKTADRKELVKLAEKHGYTPLFVWVQTEPTTTEYRSVHQKGALYTKSQYDERSKDFDFLSATEPFVVISGKHTYASQARVVLKKLINERPEVQLETGPTPPQRLTPSRGRIIR